MHENVFAPVRIWQLYHVQKLPKHAMVTGERLFGARWARVLRDIQGIEEQGRDRLLDLCFGLLESSAWEDEPSDTTRTMSNMQLATIAYVDASLAKMENWPIYVQDRKDPHSFIGIEQVFDVVVTYKDGKEVRFIGTVDGLVHHTGYNNEPVMDDNKTANRIDNGWINKWDLAHQITGYCLAASVIFGFPVVRSRIQGVKIKPTGKGEDVYPLEPLVRTEETFYNWGVWLRHTVDMYERYRDDYEHAPRYTHSCNRYFRPCALIPFCNDTRAGRAEQYQEMVPPHPSPSERAVMD